MIILTGTSIPVSVGPGPVEERDIRPDRIAHLLLYGALQLGFLRGLAGVAMAATNSHHFRAFLLTIGFGLLDEAHQIPIPERKFEWEDIFSNALGAALASGAFVLLRWRRRQLA